VHLFYIDDSKEARGCVFSALGIPVQQWTPTLEEVRDFRRRLRREYGIYIHKELHAWKFVSGRGRISDRYVSKETRCEIFRTALEFVASLPGARLFNAVFPRKQDERAFEWLVNRVNRTLHAWESYALLICDEGKEVIYTRRFRRMRAYNPIPSRFGVWLDTGELTRNIPIDRIVEDPVFKPSDQSYFLQLADFAAYALLRREFTLESKSRLGLNRAFEVLEPILVKEASRKDPYGIIRP